MDGLRKGSRRLLDDLKFLYLGGFSEIVSAAKCCEVTGIEKEDISFWNQAGTSFNNQCGNNSQIIDLAPVTRYSPFMSSVEI
jgi:hypothetical protein